MPKQTKTTNSDNKPPLLLFIGGIVLLAGLWVFAVEPLLDWRDKQRFVAAEEYLEEVYKEYIAPVSDTPLKDASYCSYTSEKYGEGDLFCVTRLEIRDGFEDKDIVMISENIFTGTGSKPVDVSGKTLDKTELEPGQSLQALNSINNTSCTISYNSPMVVLTCSDNARAEHYNVR